MMSKKRDKRNTDLASTSSITTPLAANAREQNINVTANPHTKRVIINVKWSPSKYFSRFPSSISEQDPPGSDDSHATVVQSVTEENETADRTKSPSASSKKSSNGNDEVDVEPPPPAEAAAAEESATTSSTNEATNEAQEPTNSHIITVPTITQPSSPTKQDTIKPLPDISKETTR